MTVACGGPLVDSDAGQNLDGATGPTRPGAYSAARSAQLLGFMNDQVHTSLRRLDVACALRADTASNLIVHRDGTDALIGTADDDLFDSVDEVDAVGGVGPTSLERLFSCAEAFGVVPDPKVPAGETVDVITDFSLLDPALFAFVSGPLLSDAVAVAGQKNPTVDAPVELESVTVHQVNGEPSRYDVDYQQLTDPVEGTFWRIRFTLDAGLTLVSIDTLS